MNRLLAVFVVVIVMMFFYKELLHIMLQVVGVCRHLENLPSPPKHILLVGYSYGSMITNAAADELDSIKGFVGISTPFSVFWALSLFNGGTLLKKSHSDKPKLLITGTQDNFTSEAVRGEHPHVCILKSMLNVCVPLCSGRV